MTQKQAQLCFALFVPYELLVRRQKCSALQQHKWKEKSGQTSKEHGKHVVNGCEQMPMPTKKAFQLREENVVKFLDIGTEDNASPILVQVINYYMVETQCQMRLP